VMILYNADFPTLKVHT